MYALRASKAPIWILCNGSPAMSEQFPEREDKADVVREEGTASHWCAAQRWQGIPCPIGTVAPNGIVINEELDAGVEIYLEVINGWRTDTPDIWVELELPAPNIHAAVGGTLDAGAHRAPTPTRRGLLRVGDLKMGFKLIDPFENWQLIIYFAALIHALKIDGHLEQFYDIEFTIVQPRGYGPDGIVKTWRTEMVNIRGWFNRAIAAANASQGANPTLTAGLHCEDCSARHACQAFLRSSLSILDFTSQPIPHNMHPATMGHLYARVHRARAILDAMIDSLEPEIEHAIRGGQIVPGCEIGNGRAFTKWRDDDPEKIIALGHMLGVGDQLAKPRECKTPTQAKKVIDPKIVEQLSVRLPGASRVFLTQENAVRKIFTQQPTE